MPSGSCFQRDGTICLIVAPWYTGYHYQLERLQSMARAASRGILASWEVDDELQVSNRSNGSIAGGTFGEQCARWNRGRTHFLDDGRDRNGPSQDLRLRFALQQAR